MKTDLSNGRNPHLLFKAFFEHCPEGAFLLDSERVVRAFNRAMERMTEWSREEVIGRECFPFFHCRHETGEMVCRSDCPGRLAFAGANPVYTDLILRTKTGGKIVVSSSYAYLPYFPGYVIGIMKEITERKQAEQEIRIQAITDGLTGLFNFRYLLYRLDLEIKRAQRYCHPLSLFMLDIDHFKCYNDLHGHPQGNEVLKQMADLIRENTRETNIIARYGGEEFVVILPETEKEVAVQAAERLCSIIEGTIFPFETQQPGGNLTVSMGVASYPVDAQDGDALIRVVDDYLYEAKREGRNRVRWSRPE